MILIRADKQGGGEAVKTVFGGVGRGGLSADGIAVSAAVVKVGRNIADKLPQAVIPLQSLSS